MKYYIIAGEASGDLHGSNLMKAILSKDPTAQFRFWGGDLMAAVGGEPVKHIRDLAFMGFVEVLKNLRTILGFISFCKKDIADYQPDAIIFIDYPSFNLRIAAWSKSNGYKNFFYISPQVWAWKANRIPKMKKVLDRLFVILPFEKAFFQKHDFEVDFVGHPLLDIIEQYPNSSSFRTLNHLSDKPIIAILPGSRRQEIRKMLAKMLELATSFQQYQFVIAGAPAIPRSFYEAILNQFVSTSNIRLVENQTYPLLQQAEAALVTSGTATLETALFNVPQVVCYTGNWLSYEFAKRIVKIEYIALPNLIMNQPIVKELIQYDFNVPQLEQELHDILSTNRRTTILTNYEVLHDKLGGKGASERTATIIVNDTKK